MRKITLLVLFLFVYIAVPQAFAADLNFECFGSGSCAKSGADHLFATSDGVWFPGRILTKTLKLKNSSVGIREMALMGTRSASASILENVLNISITPFLGGPVIWAGSLADFYTQDKIGMGFFEPGQDLDYNFTVAMDPVAGNYYQNLETAVNLVLGFWGDPITPAGGSGESNGGQTLGEGISASACSDQKPGSAPTLLSAAASGPNQVILTWSKASSPTTYYLLAFGTAPGVMLYGNPHIGGPETVSYTVRGLSGGTTYYFKVRAGNGCAPGEFSNELSATPGGKVLSEVPGGFEEGILGIDKTEQTPSAPPSSGILRTERSLSEFTEEPTIGGWMKNFGWIFLIPLFLLVFFFGRRF